MTVLIFSKQSDSACKWDHRSPVPLCKSLDKHLLNVSGVYRPECTRTQLISHTDTLECGQCEHNYAICLEAEGDPRQA